MNMLNTVDKTSTTDRLDVKMSKKAEICKGTVDNRTTLKVGLSETRPKRFKKVRKFDNRCYC